MLRTVLSNSRYLILVAVIGSLLAATTLLVYGGLEIFVLIGQAIAAGEVTSKGAKVLALAFIEVIDIFLLGTVFYIVALGLYELFVDDSAALPAWLIIHDLDDLKHKLIGVVIVVLAVLFLGQVVGWDGEQNLLPLGGAIALVIGTLTFFLSQKSKKDKA
jgi:uncharacterized membrane protein YqhA